MVDTGVMGKAASLTPLRARKPVCIAGKRRLLTISTGIGIAVVAAFFLISERQLLVDAQQAEPSRVPPLA
jgi:hypothetical protein